MGAGRFSRRWLGFSLLLIIIVVSAVLVWRFYISGNGSGYAVFWRQDVIHGFDNFGTATYGGGVLYAPSKGDDKVYAVNSQNGQIIWSSTVRQCDASPTIDGNVIYVGECSGPNGERTPAPKAIALNKSTGQEIWHYMEPGGIPWVGSPLVHGDYVYYTTIGSGVYALKKSDGNPIWHQDIGKIVCSVAYDRGVVFVSVNDPSGQYALNATTGEIIWHVNFGASWDSSPVVYDGMVIQAAGNISAHVMSTYVLNETNGDLIRKFEGKGGQSTPLVHDGKIFIPSYNCVVWAFDLRTGVEIWHTAELTTETVNLRRPDLSYSSPAAANGAIYYQSLSGTFYILNEADGRVRWSTALGGYGFGSPSIGDGYVFITNDSALYAFKVDYSPSDWPMFCKNQFHQSHVGP
jgi:outer membrane protein assembly factor BamB